jgi:hypothetical protein
MAGAQGGIERRTDHPRTITVEDNGSELVPEDYEP